VADGVCDLALASDTGGSIRIPAALCGVIGFKPTARRVLREGVVPLSPSFDSVGPIARSIDLVSWADAVLSGDPDPMSAMLRDRRDSLRGLVLGLPDRHVFEVLDPYVAEVFWREIRRIESLGVIVRKVPLPVLDQLAVIQANGGIPGYEAARLHAPLVASHREQMDPRVVQRIDAAAAVTERAYDAVVEARAAFITAFWAALDGVDALVMPTVPIVAPRIDELATDEAFFRVNRLLLRNTSVINVADGCAITLPCHSPGEAPVGISLASRPMSDRTLIGIAQAIVASR
jgi:aspartyl-tRNA(Asn)/glutamyl-tRNA(Gln) amidotransferase subunit A